MFGGGGGHSASTKRRGLDVNGGRLLRTANMEFATDHDRGAERFPPDRLDQVRAEQTRIIHRYCPVGVMAAGAGAVLLAAALGWSGRCDPRLALLWSVLMIGCVAAHIGLCVAFARAKPADQAWRRSLWVFTAVAGLEGAVWFFGALWMTSRTDLTQELMVLLVSSAIASGAVPVFGVYAPTYAAFFYPTIAPHLWFALAYPYPMHWLLAALLIAYLVAMTLIVRMSNTQLVEGLRLRFENIDLLEELRAQTAIALEANAQKSRFLAAASHDLRQPVHALGLFVGALRAQPLRGASRRLLDHVEAAVGSLDGLFTALLDISKLDAGVVEVEWGPVLLHPLLQRLAQELEPEASAKGVGLRAAATSQVLRSDPVLLERVLRNLMTNAVRYTQAGGVLVGARREGARVRVEVRDTGIGIAPADHEAVFREFQQVGNAERDRSRGLGLGLAIVRRIAPMIRAEVRIASEPGRGSTFSLVSEAWRGAVPRAPSRVEGAPIGLTGPIVVIDDEAEVREAMSALLHHWRLPCVVGASAQEVLLALAADAAPCLIVSDYRLRDGETGVGAIAAVRQAFGQGVPAMLVTGDTAPERLGEVEASGLLVLHKPVGKARLRAAIGALLRTGATGEGRSAGPDAASGFPAARDA